jgi:Primase C terminal 1 (PriCT-1)/Bifunctional DNA primase/polymerase, N-terminal
MTHLRNWNGGSKRCPTPWKRTPAAAADIFISRIQAASSPIAPGLSRVSDLRGDGGYVVAPPSLHPSGQLYAWSRGHSPDDVALAALPRWLLFAGRGLRARRSLEDWRHLAREGVNEGERNSTIASLTGHLLWHGVDPQVALELLLTWNRVRCKPPLDDDEVARVVASITRLHETRMPSAGRA